MTQSKPNYLLKAPLPHTIRLGVRALTYEFGGTQYSSHNSWGDIHVKRKLWLYRKKTILIVIPKKFVIEHQDQQTIRPRQRNI